MISLSREVAEADLPWDLIRKLIDVEPFDDRSGTRCSSLYEIERELEIRHNGVVDAHDLVDPNSQIDLGDSRIQRPRTNPRRRRE